MNETTNKQMPSRQVEVEKMETPIWQLLRVEQYPVYHFFSCIDDRVVMPSLKKAEKL
jgi:hypothetical protein